MEAVSSPAPRARSTSRGRASKEASVSNDGQSRAASHGRSPGSSNIPLPSPSAVHINQSLEDSLRRNEEERIRRSAERRERRWRRLEQSKQSQSRNAQPGSSSSAVTNDKARIILEDTREGGNVSVDSLDDESASPVLPSPEHVQAQVADDDSSDGQGAYYYEGYGDDFDSETEELDGRSLTRQLAETAVSVREMSRELGRARVKSNVQSVLIVTKARDNQLIKLTREIALYLMKTPRYGRSRGLIVYVDSQLKKSKRFDAAGIERDNPSLFRNETRHHHHHHHHHSHHHSNQNHASASTQGGSTPVGSATPRRSSSRRTSNHSTGATSINLFGMTRSDLGNSTASLSGLDRSYLNSHSSQSSGATTPAPGLSKPMTKLTEALVTRQIDRQLEKENARRQSQSAGQGTNGVADGTRTPGQRVAFATTAAQNENGSPASNNNSGDEQTGLLRYWTAEMCSKSPQLFDLVLTLGGDGTVLFTSWLFQHVVPPVIPFALGSLGFLTNFDFSNYKSVLEMAINEGVRVNLRMRFTATIYRAVHEDDQDESRDKHTRVIRSAESGQLYLETSEPGQWTKLESGPRHAGSSGRKDREVKCSITRPVESFEVLNDLVVDRGPSPYVSLLELFGDEHHLTTVQADGLCVATPTGSTAYSLSAGGSLVHPEIPTLLITPICPHTLSFRPMLLPDSMDLRIAVPYNSRSTAWASFDGRGRVELRQGDHIKVTASTYPFPTVCADKQSTDWFQAITRTLKWNERERQKSFVMLEHDRKEPHDSTLSKAQAENGYKTGAVPLSRGSEPSKTSVGATLSAKHKGQTSTSTSLQEESEDDDDGKFDIDDISSNPLPATAVPVEQEKQNAPVSLSSSWEASTSTERNQGVSIVRPPVQPGFQRDDGPKSPSEYDLSHSSAQHLRQYDTYPREGSNGNSSARDRTPRGSSFSRTPTSQISAAAENPRPRSRGSIRRSHRTHTRHNGERVKAFVVFGADSSDLDSSSASGDESDETAIRQACQP